LKIPKASNAPIFPLAAVPKEEKKGRKKKKKRREKERDRSFIILGYIPLEKPAVGKKRGGRKRGKVFKGKHSLYAGGRGEGEGENLAIRNATVSAR